MITLLVPKISPSDGFCNVQEQQQELGNLVVGYPTGLLGGWVAGRPNSKGLSERAFFWTTSVIRS